MTQLGTLGHMARFGLYVIIFTIDGLIYYAR